MSLSRYAAPLLGLAALAALAGPSARPAVAQTFNFESTKATSNVFIHPGALSTLTLTSGGLSATITRPGAKFDVVDTTTIPGAFPLSFGARSLDPFICTGATPFVVDFSSAVTSAGLDFGDFGADYDTFTLQAYSGLNGTGTLLASATDTYGTKSFPSQYDSATASAPGIHSITFLGGSKDFPNSLYYDNLRVTQPALSVAPEPSQTAAFAFTGLLVAARVVRARKRRA